VYFNDLNTVTIAGDNASTSSYFNSFKLLTLPKRTQDAFICNHTSTSVLCQLAAFNTDHQPFNDEIPVETSLARASNTPAMWQCRKGSELPVALAANGGWQLRSVQNVSSPYIRQAKLLTQAQLFISAISSAGGDGELVDRAVSQALCPTLSSSSTEFNISCDRPNLGVLLRQLVHPIMSETITDSEQDVTLATQVTYICAPNTTGAPLLSLQEGTIGVELQFNITLSHACCCDDAAVNCRTGYADHIARNQDRAKCDGYQRMEFVVIGFAGIAVFVLVLIAERQAADVYEPLILCESITRHPKFIVKDIVFFLNILSPVNLMENRKGSVMVAAIFGTLAALIFTEILQPNGAQFLRAIFWLFLIYPLLLCRSCHERLVGSILGLIYCFFFTFFMWLRLSCRWQAGQHDQALYVLIPAVCCNGFIGWFGFRAFVEARLRWAYSSNGAVDADDGGVRRPRAMTLSDKGTHRQYDHNELVMELLIPKATQLAVEAAEADQASVRKTWWQQIVAWVLSYGLDFREKYNYFR
jgi:hypothetical protein